MVSLLTKSLKFREKLESTTKLNNWPRLLNQKSHRIRSLKSEIFKIKYKKCMRK
jgi:hypothetical protein